MKLRIAVVSAAVLWLSSQLPGNAQIERLDLAQMVSKTDTALFGEIVGRRVVRIDDPVDGPELYFTTLTVMGRSLRDGSSQTAELSFPGGFVDDRQGVHNSEAPSADDQRIGTRVVVFGKWIANLGGGFAGTALYASHGGLYRTASAADGVRVLGRGEGYAVPTNVRLDELETSIRNLGQGK